MWSKPLLAAFAVIAIGALLLSSTLAVGALTLPPIYLMSTTFGHTFVVGTSGCSGNSPSGSGGSTNACGQLNKPTQIMDGYLIDLAWATGQPQYGLDFGIESYSAPGSYSYTNIFGSQALGYVAGLSCGTSSSASHNCWLAIAPALNESPGQVPLYAFSDYANGVYNGTSNWPDQAANANLWAPGTTYLPSETVSYGGQYFRLGGTAACIATGASGPNGDSCNWGSATSHAAALDVVTCSASFAGTNLPANSTANIDASTCGSGGTSPCSETELQTGMVSLFETPARVAFINYIEHLMSQIKNSQPSIYSQLKYMRIGFGSGAESNPSVCESEWTSLFGLTNTQYETAYIAQVQKVLTALIAYGKTIGWTVPFDFGYGYSTPSLTYVDAVAQAVAALNVSIGLEGLKGTDYASYAAGTACNNDWCHLQQAYCSKLPMCHIQEFTESIENCSSTGCLTQYYPFAAWLRGTTPYFIESFGQDARCATDSGFSDTNCPTAPYVPYMQTYSLLRGYTPAPIGGLYGLAKGK